LAGRPAIWVKIKSVRAFKLAIPQRSPPEIAHVP